MVIFRIAAVAAVAAMVICQLTGCNTSGCLDNRSSIPMAGFYSATDGSAIDVDSIDIGGVDAPGDSLLLSAGHTATFVYLPLRQTRTSSRFFLAYRWKDLDDPSNYDTIAMDYEPMPYFVSDECGALLRYRITRLTYTRHFLDSVAIIPEDSVIDNIPVENMRLYFITDAEPDQEEGAEA